MKKILLLLIPVLALMVLLWTRGSRAVEIPAVKATRETLASSLNTNGKVEPIQWAAIRAEVAGAVERVHIERGQPVNKGQLLVTVNASEALSQLSSAHSRIRQARAELEMLGSGGPAPQLAEIESGIARARADLANAQRERSILERLVAKKAATESELTAAKEAVVRAELQIQSLERRRSSLVTDPDRTAGQARLEEAENAAKDALRRIETAQMRSPMAGTLYHFDLKVGAYVKPGDLVAQVGKLNQLRVTVYIDEPELGRVEQGMPVAITWDAVPGRQWKGVVERVPLQVVALGTRQVGEVYCTIDNPDQSLIPGTNVNAEIRSNVVENAVTLPKEAIRREGDQTGVFKIEVDKVVWHKVKLGAASVTRVQIVDGATEGDIVALSADRPLKNGDTVKVLVR